VSIITNISYDHLDYLGETLTRIAEEKSQIIKKFSHVVTACNGVSLKTIKNRSSIFSSECYIYGKDFSFTSNDNLMTYKGTKYSLENFSTNLSASYQQQNLAISLAVIEILIINYNFVFDDTRIREALLDINWSGRFQFIDKKKTIILDCAHNEGSAIALVDSIKYSFPGQKFFFLVGMLKDKKHTAFINSIKDISKKILIVDGFSDRDINAVELAKLCQNAKAEYDIISDYKESLPKIMKLYNPLCITGSIYLVGSVLGILHDINKINRNI